MKIESIYNQINPFLSILGFLIGFIGLFFAFYTYNKSKNKKSLNIFNNETFKVVEIIKNFEDLKVTYKNKDVTDLFFN